ncbi:Uma2 family endonuclease [Phormidesmis priestleyi]|uniref:Uma2 family endonuclease n=1 Tax=Phormidesmis priestleyi TaxID=268141 RepID=UPI00083AACAC|nr:Uma2 family endonuclease [Phormidesmis priestleyi]
MVQYNPLQSLPTEDDLPDSDDTPVDNELQILIPSLLRAILALLWADRMDWFLGFNMGVYYEVGQPAIVPDGFLSVGVPRQKRANGRRSYVIWQEQVVPQFVLECVSHAYGGEYDTKVAKYAQIGVLYYVIYNPEFYRRNKHDSFEVYRLVNGRYIQQPGNPVWMPELGLGIGVEQGTFEGWTQNWLYWYDSQGQRLASPDTMITQERQRADQEQQRADQEQRRADEERQRADQEQQRADEGRQLADEERQRADEERRLREDLLNRLRDRGINLDDL